MLVNGQGQVVRVNILLNLLNCICTRRKQVTSATIATTAGNITPFKSLRKHL